MKKITSILLAGLLVLATTAFAQNTNTPAPKKGKPALSEVQGQGLHGPAFQRGWNQQGPRGPMFRGGPQGGPRGPMMGQGRGPQGKGCCQCQCQEKQGKGKGKQHRHGRK